MHIRNFKSLRDCRFEFRDFQVLVGPNGSGKSAFLQSLEVVGKALRQEIEFGDDFDRAYRWRGASSSDPMSWTFHLSGGNTYELRVLNRLAEETATQDGVTYFESRDGGNDQHVTIEYQDRRQGEFKGKAYFGEWVKNPLRDFLSSMRRYHLDPIRIAEQAQVAHAERPEVMSDGTGVATVLDYLLGFERKKFSAIEEALRRFVPRFQELLLRPGDKAGLKSVGIRDVDGWEFVGDQLSGGLLLFLGYLVLVHAGNAKILLLEEPENGIHPKRLQEVVELTKRLAESGDTQVVVASHSPYLVDYVDMKEVFLVSRSTESGETSLAPLSDFPGAVERAEDGYYPGELVFNFTAGDLSE